MIKRILLAATAALLLGGIVTAGAQDLKPMKLTLNFLAGGPQAGFIYAKKLGYYKDVGIDLTIEEGKGSATTAQSTPRPAFTSSCTPRNVCSSSTVYAKTTRAEPGRLSFTSRANAANMTAAPAFTSHAPRPYNFPPSMTPPNGSTVIASTGTVS